MIVLWVGLAFFVGALLGAFALALCVASEDTQEPEEVEQTDAYEE